MNDAQLDRLLKLAQLQEIHGKMGGTKPFDRLLGPIAFDLNAMADDLQKEVDARKEKADREAQQVAAEKAAEDAEAQKAEYNKKNDEIIKQAKLDAGRPAWIEPGPANEVEVEHTEVNRRL